MVIYLTHPRHGNKVAIAEAEAVADEANGWVRVGKMPDPIANALCLNEEPFKRDMLKLPKKETRHGDSRRHH